MSLAPAPHVAPLELWRIARAFITTLFNLFGAPGEIAAGEFVTPKTHALIRTWLRAGEGFLRMCYLKDEAKLREGLQRFSHWLENHQPS